MVRDMEMWKWQDLAAFLKISVDDLLALNGHEIIRRTLVAIEKLPKSNLLSGMLRQSAPYLARDGNGRQ